MKKKLLVAALAVSAALALIGCGENDIANVDADAVVEGVKQSLTEVKVDDYLKKLGDYANMEIPATLAEVTDADVDNTIQSLLTARVKTEEVTGKALESGDIANINYAGKMNGEAFEGGTDDSEAGYDLEIGSNSFIPGFEDALIGMNVGETRDIDLVFPENYYEELAGKPVVFTVKLNAIKQKVLPELTDAFVVEQAIEGVNTVDELKAFVKERLINEAQTNFDTTIDNYIMNQLIEISDYKGDLPQDRIDFYYNNIYNRDEAAATDYGLQLEGYVMYIYGYSDLDMYKEKITEYAKKSVMFDLAAAKVLENENQMITDADIEKAIEEAYEGYGYESVDAFKAATNMEEYKSYLVNRKAMDLIREKATIVDAVEE